MSFSKRMGYEREKSIQIESLDEALRTSLFNIVADYCLTNLGSIYEGYVETAQKRFNHIWTNYFRFPIHNSPANKGRGTRMQESTEVIFQYVMQEKWYKVFDLIEHIINQSDADLTNKLNSVFEREVAGYRVIEKCIVPISNAEQITAIETALNSSSRDPLKGSNEHLISALRLLSDRTEPDYRNSIKESISAVESASSVIAGVSKPKLSDAFCTIEKSGNLHPALKKAFVALYGWTCDEGGIRHALMEASNIDFADAQFMLVACSSFINYLILKNA